MVGLQNAFLKSMNFYTINIPTGDVWDILNENNFYRRRKEYGCTHLSEVR